MSIQKLISRLVLVAAVLQLAGSNVSAQETEVDGVVVLEAENFNTNLSPRSSHSWSLNSSISSYGGTGYMEALPNDGTNIGTAGATSPELQFSVTFNTGGARQVWFRGQAVANIDDSVHIGTNGGGSAALTLSQYGNWQWSNTLQAGGAASITVSAGTQTINVWMREDGLALDRIILTTSTSFNPTLGNAWHIPTNAEPAGVASMRSPLAVYAGSPVTIYNGNQFQGGGGGAANQATDASRIFYKKATDAVWSSVGMSFHSEAANNRYYSGIIPAAAFAAGDTVQYYLKIAYSDRLPTFLYGSDSVNHTTEFESQAQAEPYVFAVQSPLTPTEQDGVVILEAENFNTNLSPRSFHSWTPGTSTAGFSGSGYMESLPNDGTNLAAGASSPELQFSVNFATTGTKYVWIRGHATANTDDSAHVGSNAGGSAAVALSEYGNWQWSNALHEGGTATINVTTIASPPQTVNFWMREDGLRIDRLILTTNASFNPTLGNAWHIPTNAEPAGVANMRLPFVVTAGSPVTIYNGNQYQGGGGGAGDQSPIASRLFYKKATDAVWSSVGMSFHSQAANNRYYSGIIPAAAFAAGDTVQYYLKIAYSDRLPTFLYGSDSVNHTTEFESQAQAEPYVFTVQMPLQPTGNYLSFASGQHEARIYEDSGHIELAQPDLAGTPLASVITFAPPTVRIADRGYSLGHVISSTPLGNGIELTQAIGATNVTAQLTFTNDGVMRYEVTNWNGLTPTETSISAASDASEHFYGFGEKFNALDQSGKKVRMMTSDIGGDKNDNSYKVMPWFLSTRGYGFHLDSTAESFFDMRNGAADRYVIQNLFGTLKFNVVAGPKLTDALSRFTGYTGRPYLPPPWVFGTWVSSDIWRNGGEVRYAITKHRDSGIPISVFVFDSPWEKSYNDFTWNLDPSNANTQWRLGGTYEGTTSHPNASYDGFSSVTEMMTFLQQNGVKVICWMTPFINTSSNNEGIPGQNTGQSPNYAFAAANNYFVRSSPGGPPLSRGWWKGTGSPVDFTNPAAKSWLTDQLQTLVTQSNVATASAGLEPAIGGFKTDDGENINNGPDYIPTTAVYSDGRTGIEMRNGYCIEYHKAISGVLGNNGILFARSGFTGTGAYPAGWPGDNQPTYTQANGLRSVITSGESAAMSGYSIWGHDIGGYQNANFLPDRADLFMRWSQYGAFSPLMQMHRNVNPANYEQYPWGYGATALANYVTYAKLHSQLFPYIYTYAKEASVNGLPIIRPLVLLNPTDASVYAVQHTYYFGNELLVAPMHIATSTTRTVRLPAGNWYDYWTNAQYAGGAELAWSNADTSKMPLFVRESSIVPMLANVPQTLCDANYVNNPAVTTMDSALLFLVYPGSTAANFTIYDGTTAQCTITGTVTTIPFTSVPRPMSFKIFAASSPAGVERNGLRLPNRATQNDFNTASFGWFYDAAAKFLHVKFSHDGGSASVTFGPDTAGNGVTDSWKDYFGVSDENADSDGDGMTNREEYYAGTNPNNSQSTFAIESVTEQSGGGFQVTWPSQLGITYRVEWKNALTDLSWQVITPDFTGTGSPLNWVDDGSQTGGLPAAQRFYHIIVP